MTIGAWLLVLLFGAWLLASILVLIPRLASPIRALDPLSLIPEWKFFAPNPAQGDYHLLYRDQLSDQTVTQWTEVALGGRRHWWHCLWNPDKRARKALFDAISHLGRNVRDQPEELEVSVAYLTLLNHVSERPRLASSRMTQFLILYSHADRPDADPEVLFLSGMHSLDET